MTRIVELRTGVLEKNDLLARALRQRFAEACVRVSNWVSSPGTGKTELLEQVLREGVYRGMSMAALVGDCATDNDAQRLARSGAPVRQIVTESMCHLEAEMLESNLLDWNLADFDALIVENVGNLVCPTGYDLGEDTRVALLSVTEGEDKPAKYPQLFHSADVVVITKTDIAQAVAWDRSAALSAIRSVNPDAPIIETSARTGVGVAALLDLLIGSSAFIHPSQLQEAP
jgi:hydrogenase nickel incorporation protein HypB